MSEDPNKYVEENIIPSPLLDEWQAKLNAQCDKIDQDMKDLKIIIKCTLTSVWFQCAQDARRGG